MLEQCRRYSKRHLSRQPRIALKLRIWEQCPRAHRCTKSALSEQLLDQHIGRHFVSGLLKQSTQDEEPQKQG